MLPSFFFKKKECALEEWHRVVRVGMMIVTFSRLGLGGSLSYIMLIHSSL